jgi:uncharacterized membrane protein YphA (DoxX/SURF4 family)
MSEYVYAVVQLALGAVYLQSSIGKVTHIRSFLEGVEDYRVLPPSLARPFGLVVVLLEVVLCVTHIAGVALGLAAVVGSALLCSFVIAIAINLARNREIPCHCLDQEGAEIISFRSLARLGLMIPAELALVRVYGLSSSTVSPGRVLESGGDAFVILGWSMLALQGALWLLRINHVFTLIGRVVPAKISRKAA